MIDFLDVLATDAKKTVEEGYYELTTSSKAVSASLKRNILNCKLNPIIAEVKGSSPSKGTIKRNFDIQKVAQSMLKGGAMGISVLTEPKHFSGSLNYISKIRQKFNTPILMKDIIVSSIQLNAASKVSADVVLLIQAIFDRQLCECGMEEMIDLAHSKNLEVLLETHNRDEFCRAVSSSADLVGINNRDLSSLKVNLSTTSDILKVCSPKDKVIIAESGIATPQDLLLMKGFGARAFLIGSSIMLSENIESKVSEFVNAS